MANDGYSKIKAHGASHTAAPSKLENKLILITMLLYLAVFTESCLTSEDPASQELLQIPPWSPFRRTHCTSGKSVEALVGKRVKQVQTRGRAGPTSVVAASSAAMFSSAPCACDTRLTILDLGSSSIPRYLPSVDCRVASTHCRREGRCHQRRYKIRVLRRRHISLEDEVADEDKDLGEEDDSLPESLRLAWRFEERTINVACECIL